MGRRIATMCAGWTLLAMAGWAQAPGTTTRAAAATTPASPTVADLTHMTEVLRARLDDFAQLARYRSANAELPPSAPGRVVFYGDSITDAWAHHSFFPGKPYVDRGISGQTTPQMLIRFRQDVIALHPETVLILAGTNDIAGNTGPSTLDMIEDNLASMTEIARANGIRVVLCSVLPAAAYPWRPGIDPAAKIRELNAWMAVYARENKLVYLDYYTAMAGDLGGMKPGISSDGVHPNNQGYTIMAPLAEQAIQDARHEHVHKP